MGVFVLFLGFCSDPARHVRSVIGRYGLSSRRSGTDELHSRRTLELCKVLISSTDLILQRRRGMSVLCLNAA